MPSAVKLPVMVPSTTRAEFVAIIAPFLAPAVKLNNIKVLTIRPSYFHVPTAGALFRPSMRVK